MEGGLFSLIIRLAILVLIIAGLWKTFEKAGQPGWAAIVPIYNLFILVMLAGKPWWWLLLLLVPIVNIVIFVMISLGVAKNFGQGTGYGIGLFFLPFVFYPMLGFGDAKFGSGS